VNCGTVRHQPGDDSPRQGPGGLDDHLQVITVGEAPHDLPDIVARRVLMNSMFVFSP